MTAKELAEKSGVKLWKVYYIAARLGRFPSVAEIVNYKARVGRPPKHYKYEEKNNGND